MRNICGKFMTFAGLIPFPKIHASIWAQCLRPNKSRNCSKIFLIWYDYSQAAWFDELLMDRLLLAGAIITKSNHRSR